MRKFLLAVVVVAIGIPVTQLLQERGARTASQGATAAAPEVRDEVVVDAACANPAQSNGVALWQLTFKNRSRSATWRDLEYRTTYAGESGTVLKSRTGVIPVRLGPGETRRVQSHNDGLLPQHTTTCTLELTGGTRD